MFLLPKVIHRFKGIPTKIPVAFFFNRNRKTALKFVWNQKRPQIAKSILNKNKTNVITLSGFKIHYKAIVNQNIMVMALKTDI